MQLLWFDEHYLLQTLAGFNDCLTLTFNQQTAKLKFQDSLTLGEAGG